MTWFTFFILQLVAIILDLFFFPSFFPATYWIDISIVVVIGGIALFENTSLALSVPLLLLKLSYVPHTLILPVAIAYGFMILFYYISQKVLQISSLVLFQAEILLLFPFYLLFMSQFVSLSIWASFLLQILVALMIPYPILLYLQKKMNTHFEKRRISS